MKKKILGSLSFDLFADLYPVFYFCYIYICDFTLILALIFGMPHTHAQYSSSLISADIRDCRNMLLGTAHLISLLNQAPDPKNDF